MGAIMGTVGRLSQRRKDLRVRRKSEVAPSVCRARWLGGAWALELSAPFLRSVVACLVPHGLDSHGPQTMEAMRLGQGRGQVRECPNQS